MKRLSIITLQFYRLLLLYNVAFTVLAMALVIFGSGSINSGVFLYAKIIGFMAAVGLHYFSSKETYFYFRNAGYRIKQIVIVAFAVDISVCIVIIALSKLILYAAAHIKG